MSVIETLPPEVLHNVLQWLYPDDLLVLPLVSHAFYSFVKGNKSLCRDIFWNNLDIPENTDLDWEKELYDVLKLQFICRAGDVNKKKQHLPFVFETIDRLLRNATAAGGIKGNTTHLYSHNAAFLQHMFDEPSNGEAFLERSFLFERARNEVHHPIRVDEPPKEAHQQSAKLHCLYGRPILTAGRTRSSKTYPYACSKVYDLRQYTHSSKWGPFLSDGSDRVDWEKVEAIMIVLGHNTTKLHLTTKVFTEVWDNPFSGSWAYSSAARPPLAPTCELHSLAHQDPYGITGTWFRIVCFLDYNDFFSYNFPIGDLMAPGQPRPAIDVGEATRLIVMRVHVTSIEPPGPDDGQELPVVHFSGASRSLDNFLDDNANSGLRGVVRLTKDGEVRWTTWSIFNGHERWRSEGIQVGGVRSARGVIGNWFESDYDPHGPAGPTAFWQASQAEESLMPDEFFEPNGMMLFDDSDLDSLDEEETGAEGAEVADELMDLLAEADMTVEDVMRHYVENHANTG